MHHASLLWILYCNLGGGTRQLAIFRKPLFLGNGLFLILSEGAMFHAFYGFLRVSFLCSPAMVGRGLLHGSLPVLVLREGEVPSSIVEQDGEDSVISGPIC